MPRKSRKQHARQAGEYLLASVLALILLTLIWAVWGIARKEEKARSAVDERKAELAILNERKAVYEANVAELGSVRGQEATLRQNHGMAKAGEEVIIVVQPKDDGLDPHIPWYKRFLGFFGIW